jgi:RHS repeat-associated protein
VEKRRGGSVVQRFLYQDNRRLIAELDGSNNVVSRFVYGSNPITPDWMVRNGVTYRIIIDQVGSVRLVVNAATGAVQQRLDYDAFGNVTSDTSPGFQPFGYAGGLYDSDTRLVRFGARDYDAETGRWTAKDTSLFAGADTNLYRYAGGDPINYLDPKGRFFFAAAAAVAEGGAAVYLGITAVGIAATLITDYYVHHYDTPPISPPGESNPPGPGDATEYPDPVRDTEFPGGGTVGNPVIPKHDPLPTKDIFPPDWDGGLDPDFGPGNLPPGGPPTTHRKTPCP